MPSHRFILAAALAGTLMLPLTAVSAQNSFGDNSVPGVCMLSRSEVLSNSKVGKAATARLKQLASQANNQLQTERKPLDSDIQKFQKEAKSLSQTKRESEQKALQQRMQAFQNKARELDARIRVTRSKAMQQIAVQLDPLVVGSYKQHGCGILLDRDDVLGGNPKNDLTADVIQSLDKKMPSITFNLAPLPKQTK